MSEPIIKIDNLNVVYNMGKSNEVHALKDINLEIFPREFVIFFGPSGCGKSTLLYSIAGLETNFTGKINWGKDDISKFKKREAEKFHQQRMGMIFQAYYLINSLSVINNVALPKAFMSNTKSARRKKAMELLKYFGVDSQAEKLPSELSGGQQQRVAIARSLVNDPEVILADEPVGNLDSRSADEVLSLLKELNEKQGKTIVLVTHNPEHIKLAHRIVYLKDGYILEVKTNERPDEVSKEKPVMVEKTGSDIPKELELLIRTYSSLSAGELSTMLIPFKAKQIVSEVLTEMSAEEIFKLEKQTEGLLVRGVSQSQQTLDYLDMEVEKGGLGFDRRRAVMIVDKIKSIVGEIKSLEEIDEIEKKHGYHPEGIDPEAIQIRQYLFDVFDMRINGFDDLENIDRAIDDRLKAKIDKSELQKRLDLPKEQFGAGMDKRTAKKFARKIELLLLGKYK